MDRIAVYELQDALMQIFLAQGIRGAVYPDGIYGPETTEAVRTFQQMEGLPVTGEADRETWERIQTRLDEIIKAREVLPIPASALMLMHKFHRCTKDARNPHDRDGREGSLVLFYFYFW